MDSNNISNSHCRSQIAACGTAYYTWITQPFPLDEWEAVDPAKESEFSRQCVTEYKTGGTLDW